MEKTYQCDKHGLVEPVMTGLIVLTPLCSVCMTEFKQMFHDLCNSGNSTTIPIIKGD